MFQLLQASARPSRPSQMELLTSHFRFESSSFLENSSEVRAAPAPVPQPRRGPQTLAFVCGEQSCASAGRSAAVQPVLQLQLSPEQPDERRFSAAALTRVTVLKASPCFFASPDWSASEATGAQLRAKWEAALGPKYQLLVGFYSRHCAACCSSALHRCVCVSVCVVVCFQVVNLDPVIEDDAELQKYSKVRRLLRVWVLAQLGFLTLALTLAPAHPHAASRS